MPLEALRADITPVGMHYLLIHYDVPFVDPEAHILTLEGFDEPVSLGIAISGRGRVVTAPVTFECAGNGRALFETRPVSQPWLLEAVGTAEWTGTPARPTLARGGRRPMATVEIVFTGSIEGWKGTRNRRTSGAWPLDEALRGDVLRDRTR